MSPNSTTRHLFQVLAVSTLSLSALGLGGCWAGGLSEGGDHISNDKFVYVSDSYSPKTITLIDTRTKQPVWTGDIPVGQQMVVKFRQGRLAAQGDSMPDTLLWGLTRAGGYSASNLNSVPCPPAAARRLEMSVRPTPEMPTGDHYALTPPPPYGEMPMPPNRSVGPGSAPATPAHPAAPATPAAPANPATPKPANHDMKPPAVDLPDSPAPASAPAPAPAPAAEPSK
jgi:hypothetical protein